MRSNWKVGVAALALVAAAVAPAAADAPVEIQFDPQTQAFSSLLPFHTPFTLDIPAPLDTINVSVRFWAVAEKKTCATEHAPIVLSARAQAAAQGATEKHYQVSLPAQHTDTHYCITSRITRPLSTDDQASITATVVSMADTVARTGWAYTPSVRAELEANLGALALARITSRSDNPTLIDVLDKDLRADGTGAPFAFEMASSAKEFASGRDSAAKYYSLLTSFQGNPAFAAATRDVLAKLKAAKLDAVTGSMEPGPLSDDLLTALQGVARAANASVCRTDSHDCEDLRADWWSTMNASAQGYKTAKENYANELKKIVAQSVSAPTDSHSEKPSYVSAAPLYISGDVGFVMPWFISGEASSHGVDAQLYVAVRVSFAAIDKDLPLAIQGGWRRRVSHLGGI